MLIKTNPAFKISTVVIVVVVAAAVVVAVVGPGQT